MLGVVAGMVEHHWPSDEVNFSCHAQNNLFSILGNYMFHKIKFYLKKMNVVFIYNFNIYS